MKESNGLGAEEDGQNDSDSTALERALKRRAQGETVAPFDDERDKVVDALIPFWEDLLEVSGKEFHALVQTGDEIDDDAGSGNATPEPIRQDDPLAIMLGLTNDGGVALDGLKFSVARKSAALNLRDLVEGLHHRGWDVDMKTVLGWHTGSTLLPRAMITAVAAVVNVEPESLLARAKRQVEQQDPFDDERIHALMAEWSSTLNITPSNLRRRVDRLLAGANMRNSTRTSPAALLAVLETLRRIPQVLDGH